MTAPKDRDALLFLISGEIAAQLLLRGSAMEAAQAALAALEAAGYRVVPVVATDAMCDAAATSSPDEWADDPIACQDERLELRGIWYLMLAASPYAPNPEARSDG